MFTCLRFFWKPRSDFNENGVTDLGERFRNREVHELRRKAVARNATPDMRKRIDTFQDLTRWSLHMQMFIDRFRRQAMRGGIEFFI
jgi:hypothetical protein